MLYRRRIPFQRGSVFHPLRASPWPLGFQSFLLFAILSSLCLPSLHCTRRRGNDPRGVRLPIKPQFTAGTVSNTRRGLDAALGKESQNHFMVTARIQPLLDLAQCL